MGSLISCVFSLSLFRILTIGAFSKYPAPKYFSYIDDTLLIYAHSIKLQDLLNKLNKIKHTIKFMYEK